MIDQGLGEDLATKQQWSDGLTHIRDLPLQQIVGDAGCINDGETFENRIDGRRIKNGYSLKCFTLSELEEINKRQALAMSVCSLQYAYARLVQWVYADDRTKFSQFIAAWLGPAWTVDYYLPASPLPEVAVAHGPGAAIVVVEGTTDAQQFALQAMYSLQPVENFGVVKTSPFWYTSATWVISCIRNSGIFDPRPIQFVGHSYGGASTAIACGRLLKAFPGHGHQSLTFGCPKPGDVEFSEFMRSWQLSIENEFDLIPQLSPSGEELALVAGVILGIPTLAWESWRPSPNSILQSDNGERTFNVPNPLDYDEIFLAVSSALISLPLAPIAAHAITEYAKRIRLFCPNPVWPMNDALYALLDNP